MNKLIVSLSPHVHSGDSISRNMYLVIIALIPALLISFISFGMGAIITTAISVASCVFFEWAINKFCMKNDKCTVCDGSAVLTGLLLAFNLPSNIAPWIVVIGAFFAIGVVKMTFGGLGCNLFNPALAGRAFLLISFPVAMTTWPLPGQGFGTYLDAQTGATPLAMLQEMFKSGDVQSLPLLQDMMLGNTGGSLGEVCELAILIGFVFLLWKKVITWHIPVAFIGTALVFSAILWLINPAHMEAVDGAQKLVGYMNPLMTIFTGGIMLGACFMATDMVTSPMAKSGQLIFGVGCGLLTIIIRTWGAYPEGVSFAILLMNSVTPLINRWCKPKRFAN